MKKTKQEIFDRVESVRHNKTNPVYELRVFCEECDQDDLHELKNHFNCTSDDRLGMVVLEAITQLRHLELKKPNWVERWTFVCVIIGIVVAIFAWLFPRSAAPDASKSPTAQQFPVGVQPLSPTLPSQLSNSLQTASKQLSARPAKSSPAPATAHPNSVAAPASPKK